MNNKYAKAVLITSEGYRAELTIEAVKILRAIDKEAIRATQEFVRIYELGNCYHQLAIGEMYQCLWGWALKTDGITGSLFLTKEAALEFFEGCIAAAAARKDLTVQNKEIYDDEQCPGE